MKTLSPDILNEVVDRLVTHLQPETIYLYGSHAYGTPHVDSDVDLYVIVGESTLPPHVRDREAYRSLRGVVAPIEVMVATCSEFAERSQWLNSIERTISEKGQRLYASDGS